MVTSSYGGRANRSGSHEGQIRAVAYVRMSTDLQEFSPENQLAAIMGYAEQRGFEVIRVYDDAGRSGLRADNRPGHRRLMADIESGRADFEAVIIYDISRWGRFQDADESGYYEHICSRAGIQLHYCAEQFENDGSLSSNVVKSIKRLMAGEFSRELSEKVSAGKALLIKKGFRQGGMAGFGLRRMLVDECGNRKGELAFGDRKSLQTDRVILVPGPPREVETVRRIYKMFVDERRRESEIAAILNQEKILTYRRRQWTRVTVRGVLTNPKYVGDNVSNRVSTKLKQKRVVNAPDRWIRVERIFEPIVDRQLHYAAATIIKERSRRLSNGELLALLRELLIEVGTLSGLIIDERETMLSSSALARRFGGLPRAYKLVGYQPDRDYRFVEENRELRRLYPYLVQEVVAGIQDVGGHAFFDLETDLLTVNEEFTASVVIARCVQPTVGRPRWRIRFDAELAPDIIIAIRMDQSNRRRRDYYLLPRIDMTGSNVRLRERNGLSLDGYRFDNLDFLYALAARIPIMEAA
ncbi:MAG: recombinase family protein [Pseudomonadota bacterium]